MEGKLEECVYRGKEIQERADIYDAKLVKYDRNNTTRNVEGDRVTCKRSGDNKTSQENDSKI